MLVDLLVVHAGQLITVAGHGPARGTGMRDLAIIPDGAVAITDGLVVEVGHTGDLCTRFSGRNELDVHGQAVIPGLVDPHTHLPWAGNRAGEFELRLGGATYMQIMGAGGGINHTVSHTRAASEEQLVSETRQRVRRMAAYGTTTAEAKTGYGLDVTNELKQLRTIDTLQREGPITLVPTFLGAHAIPPEYSQQPDDYVGAVVTEQLPAIWEAWQALRHDFPADCPLFCDVFCETGAFGLAQTRRILLAAERIGMRAKLHVDEFAPLGGTPLGVELSAISVDHLVTTSAEDIGALAASQTIGVALPGTPFGLAQRTYSPGRELIDSGGALALATDLNPGTCWCENLQFMIALACRNMRLLPAEALMATTRNAACAIGMGGRYGSLEPGKAGDLVVLDSDDYRQLAYRFGVNQAALVIKGGKVIVDNSHA
jgi:imidazolonepropionase